MREILFRGKTEISERWVVGDLLQWSGGEMCICENRNHFEKGKYRVIPETVGEYTGLTDKNGRKIFEGDILGAHLDVNYPENETIAVIVWANNAWCIQELGAEPDIIGDDELKNDGWEIIGNIHDNPELLEVDNGDM